jgi:hypothetical protein
MKITRFLLPLLVVVSASAAEIAPFQMKGVLDTGSEKLFGLSTSSGDRNGWVPLGKQFEGYTLKTYDDAKGVLYFLHDGKTYELSLAASKIVTAEGPKGTPATVADAAAVVDRMRFEEMIGKMMDGQKKMAIDMAKQMAARAGSEVDPKDLEAYQSKVMEAVIEAMDLPQLKKDVTDIYARTFTKEELTALGDFYATPAGQAMVDKQPAVQEQLQAALLPRLVAAGPKLQQLGTEFYHQQEAKKKAAAGSPSVAAPKN